MKLPDEINTAMMQTMSEGFDLSFMAGVQWLWEYIHKPSEHEASLAAYENRIQSLRNKPKVTK